MGKVFLVIVPVTVIARKRQNERYSDTKFPTSKELPICA